MSPVEIATAVVGIASIVLLGVQVQLAARALRDDHLRRRQQATLEYLVLHVRPHWKDSLRLLKQDLDAQQQPLSPELLARITSEPETKASIEKVLGNIEHMAVGVNVGVYDLELINRASGGFLIRTYSQFLPYIELVQQRQARAYVEFEQLIRDLRELRGSPAPAQPTTT